MFIKDLTIKTLKLSIFVVVLLTTLQCTAKSEPASDLPKDILGISVGISKADAQKRLEEIAVFERDERKNQQVWKMKDNSRFGNIAVGYDKDERIRYVTGFVDKDAVKEKIRFTDVGDLSKAKQEILEPHYRYIWEVPATENNLAYFVNIYGDNRDFVTTYSLAKIYKPDELKESEEEKEK